MTKTIAGQLPAPGVSKVSFGKTNSGATGVPQAIMKGMDWKPKGKKTSLHLQWSPNKDGSVTVRPAAVCGECGHIKD